MSLTEQKVLSFRAKIYDFYAKNKREFAWRSEISAYRVVVSEIMLQQTQTARVVFKFDNWVKRFPTIQDVSKATVAEILLYWQGLGYNRRGLALHEFAKRVQEEFRGVIPDNPAILQTCKGIGVNTAGSICAFAFNKPVVFIETNIRTVFMYEFFQNEKNVHDKDLLPLIEACLDKLNPREWYYALMDYGVYLKKQLKISNKNSKHYSKQSRFQGSRRQIRGAIVRIIHKVNRITYDELYELIFYEYPDNKHNVWDVVQELKKEGFLQEKDDMISSLQ